MGGWEDGIGLEVYIKQVHADQIDGSLKDGRDMEKITKLRIVSSPWPYGGHKTNKRDAARERAGEYCTSLYFSKVRVVISLFKAIMLELDNSSIGTYSMQTIH